MLRSLSITDMLIIDRLELEFEPGLNVLTGETGAGKSILLDALGFVLGWRGRADLVREGAELGKVQAVFDLAQNHPAHAILANNKWEADGELIISRSVARNGRKSARVNGNEATVQQLLTISDTLVELHGQQDDRGLLDPRSHRAILDDFGQSDGPLQEVRAAWAALRQAKSDRTTLAESLESIRSEETELRQTVKTLEALAVRSGEYKELTERFRFMKRASRLHEPLQDVAILLSTAFPDGKRFPTRLASAISRIERVSDLAEGRLAPLADALSRGLSALEEAEAEIEAVIESLDFNDEEFSRIAKRIDKLEATAQTFSVDIDALPDHLAATIRRLAELDDSGLDRAAADAAVARAEAAYTAAAAALTALRRAAAMDLAQAMAGELAPLKMERATFTVSITPADPGPDGADLVTFEAATNPGAPAGPLNRIASGGELSRFLLALKVCLTRGSTGLTLIFDEIDRGVGGATADAVGRRLAALSQGAQVLAVTHSPQVAARGQHHWRVEKAVHDDRTLSRVVPLDPAGRVDEIARMLAGDSVTDAARAAAEALLAAG